MRYMRYMTHTWGGLTKAMPRDIHHVCSLLACSVRSSLARGWWWWWWWQICNLIYIFFINFLFVVNKQNSFFLISKSFPMLRCSLCTRWWLYCRVDLLLWKGRRFDNDNNDDGRIDIWSFTIKLQSRRWKWKRRTKIWNPFFGLEFYVAGVGISGDFVEVVPWSGRRKESFANFYLSIHLTIWLSSIWWNILLVANSSWYSSVESKKFSVSNGLLCPAAKL